MVTTTALAGPMPTCTPSEPARTVSGAPGRHLPSGATAAPPYCTPETAPSAGPVSRSSVAPLLGVAIRIDTLAAYRASGLTSTTRVQASVIGGAKASIGEGRSDL